ncbi:hypothetical protein N44_00662 [Microcystis aeruginosa NIES-44]|uniref:Uncharacterized protein n=1 Tax=Microcystis aeruginosa NIES-44 TaxID=449439 RepID=A0A0A1VP87_MICAE|nr:hypothetical protein N44_00662 [Microcystis aeruginosa NIES-44]
MQEATPLAPRHRGARGGYSANLRISGLNTSELIKIARFWNPEKSQPVLRRGIGAVPGYCQLSSLALV